MKKIRHISILFVLLLSMYFLWENVSVGTTRYDLSLPQLDSDLDGVTIAHVSDLHNCAWWKQAIRILQEERPDLICITGDIVDGSATDIEKALAFATEAVRIAPCYYVTGNHELIISDSEYDQLILGLRSLGVYVLQNETVSVQIGKGSVTITGASWGSYLYQSQLDENADLTLLLAHAPEEFDSYVSAGFDLVLSGHAHGGQFRIPLMGGMYAPGQGILPEYDSGIFTSGNTTMVVSRGIGNSIIPVRILNRPELVLIELKSA